MPFPHALLRAGYPFAKTLGMRRSTYFPVDLAIAEDRIYVMTRLEIGGGYVRMVGMGDDDLGALDTVNSTYGLIGDDVLTCVEGGLPYAAMEGCPDLRAL